MKTVLLPVKDFAQSKQRLAGALEPRQRAGLAQAMLTDVLRAIADARRPERVVVYTASEDVARIARPYDFYIIEEANVAGHSLAVNRMVDELIGSASQILSIAGDLPTLTGADVDLVFSSVATDVSFVTSRDGTGTNAALFVSPARIRMEYGDGSLQRHLLNAETARLTASVLKVPGIEFDVDTPEDLQAYIKGGPNCSHTWRFVSSLGKLSPRESL